MFNKIYKKNLTKPYQNKISILLFHIISYYYSFIFNSDFYVNGIHYYIYDLRSIMYNLRRTINFIFKYRLVLI